jgi:hypothetical protein
MSKIKKVTREEKITKFGGNPAQLLASSQSTIEIKSQNPRCVVVKHPPTKNLRGFKR